MKSFIVSYYEEVDMFEQCTIRAENYTDLMDKITLREDINIILQIYEEIYNNERNLND